MPPLVEPPLVESADRTSAKHRRRTRSTPLPEIVGKRSVPGSECVAAYAARLIVWTVYDMAIWAGSLANLLPFPGCHYPSFFLCLSQRKNAYHLFFYTPSYGDPDEFVPVCCCRETVCSRRQRETALPARITTQYIENERGEPASLQTKASSPSAPNIFAARKCCSCQILYSMYSFTAIAEGHCSECRRKPAISQMKTTFLSLLTGSVSWKCCSSWFHVDIRKYLYANVMLSLTEKRCCSWCRLRHRAQIDCGH